MLNAIDKLDVRKTLTDYATYDAGLLLNEFLRTALQFVYSSGRASEFEPQLHRSLMLRLLSNGVQISDRFTCSLIVELRQPLISSHPTSHAKDLARRLWEDVSVEMATLQRAIRHIEPTFAIRDSFLDPIRYAHCLEAAISEVVPLTMHEKYVVFQGWSGCFSMVMRQTYSKYVKVIENLEDGEAQLRQDFVDTMPLSIDARASLYTRTRSEWMPLARAG